MIDIHQFSPETLLIAGTVLGLILGSLVTAFIVGLSQPRRILKARCQAFAAAEDLYLKRRATDHRDTTSARL
jgi:hypothetical protein